MSEIFTFRHSRVGGNPVKFKFNECLFDAKELNIRLVWILSCRAHWHLHMPIVTQACNILHETPASPYA